VAVLATPLHIYLCVKLLGVSPFYILHDGKSMILATAFMAFGIAILKWGIFQFIPSTYLILTTFVLIFAGTMIYAGSLWFLDRSFILNISSLLKKAAA
jgi:hypothetical protein